VRPKVDQRAGLLSLLHLGNFRRTGAFTTTSVSEMTYIVSSGALNSTHSLSVHHICIYLVSIHQRATPLLNSATLLARLLLIYRPEGMEGWVGLLGWPIADALPTKWSYVNRGSGVDQGKSAGYEPTFLPLSHAA